MTEINPAVLAAAQATADKPPSEDKLEKVRELVRTFRDKESEKEDLEARVKAINQELEEIKFKTLVDLLDEAGIPSITIEAEGNHPRVTATSGPYYRANIPAEAPEERRRAAFDYLDSAGSGDLIKTLVMVQFSREQRADAIKFKNRVEKAGFLPMLKEEVHWATLTAWLKEQFEKDVQPKPPLDTLFATVGRIVKLKEK